MRKLVVLTFVSLDGVMQAPGGPEEDESGNFELGGWTHPYFDDFAGKIMGEQIKPPFDLLLGKRTYELFADYWPKQDESTSPVAGPFRKAKKYVVSNSPVELSWKESILIDSDVVSKIREIKKEDGPMIQVHGSSNFVQTLLKNDLIDELWLKFFPVTLGKGKRLFGEGTQAAGYELIDSKVSPSGVIFANYKRAGEVKTGSFADTRGS